MQHSYLKARTYHLKGSSYAEQIHGALCYVDFCARFYLHNSEQNYMKLYLRQESLIIIRFWCKVCTYMLLRLFPIEVGRDDRPTNHT